MTETVEVDRDYLRALEVVAVAEHRMDTVTLDSEPVNSKQYAEALDRLDEANLKQPRQPTD